MVQLRRLARSAARKAAESAAVRLAADPRVQLVYVFGSAADAQRAAVHDVDLAVLTEPRVPLDDLMRLRADLVAIAGAEIDLVSLNDASVVLAHEVADTGQCLYARRPELETDFVIKARARYWDFRPFLDEQWRLTAERLEARRRGAPP